MPEMFLTLADKARAGILSTVATRVGLGARILEKDVWVCWALQETFRMPGHLRMAFKGGTSLSKVYGVIARFSEDIDVTIDYRDLDRELDPFADGLSKSKLKKASEQLRNLVGEHLRRVVVPHLSERLSAMVNHKGCGIELHGEEQISVCYNSVVEQDDGYMPDHVRLDFGGRNTSEPKCVHSITPYLAQSVEGLSFPTAIVDVLSGERTFWEKATLIHMKCNKPDLDLNPERLSRHWYDLAKLSLHEIGKTALANRDLLRDVVRHKAAFFHAGYADYEACLEGGFKLIPASRGLRALRIDFEEMRRAGMFFEEPPGFDEIVTRLSDLQSILNRH